MSSIARLLTVPEVCAALRLSRAMVYRLIDEGFLRRTPLPGCAKVVVSEDEIQRYLAAEQKSE